MYYSVQALIFVVETAYACRVSAFVPSTVMNINKLYVLSCCENHLCLPFLKTSFPLIRIILPNSLSTNFVLLYNLSFRNTVLKAVA